MVNKPINRKNLFLLIILCGAFVCRSFTMEAEESYETILRNALERGVETLTNIQQSFNEEDFNPETAAEQLGRVIETLGRMVRVVAAREDSVTSLQNINRRLQDIIRTLRERVEHLETQNEDLNRQLLGLQEELANVRRQLEIAQNRPQDGLPSLSSRYPWKSFIVLGVTLITLVLILRGFDACKISDDNGQILNIEKAREFLNDSKQALENGTFFNFFPKKT